MSILPALHGCAGGHVLVDVRGASASAADLRRHRPDSLGVGGDWRARRHRPMTKKWLMCVAIALLTGSQVLLGHPQSLWFALIAESLFTLFLFLGSEPPGGRGQRWSSASRWGWHGRRADLRHTCHANDVHPRRGGYRSPGERCLGTGILFSDGRALQTLNVYHGNYFGVVPLVLVLWWLRCPPPCRGGDHRRGYSNHLLPASRNRETAVRLVSWWLLRWPL